MNVASPAHPLFWNEPSDDDKSQYDPLYLLNRDSEFRQDIRNYVEELWSRYAPYCGDTHFLHNVRRQFQQFTWQMYSGVCLVETGNTLEKSAPEGPDHKALIGGRRVWVECIAPNAGQGENIAERTIQSWTKAEAGGYGMFKPPPDEKIQARLTGALANKVQQHRKWVAKGIVSANEPFIIAIGAGIVPDTDLVRDLPHIVRALFGFGEPALEVEIGGEGQAELVPTYRDAIKRMSKTEQGEKDASISLRGFLDENLYPEVSAVMFCSQGIWNPPRKVGRDIITVYNAVARQPLQPGSLAIGQEFWAADGVLQRRDNREPLPDPEIDEETRKQIDEAIAAKRGRRE